MNLSKKEQTRFFKDEIEDFSLSPLHPSPLEERLKIQKAQKIFSTIQSQALQQREKQKNSKPPSEGRFEQLMDPTNKKILSSLFSFLPLSSVFSLIKTCKKVKELLAGIWRPLIERKLDIRLSSEVLFSNPDYMKNLYTSLHFPLKQENLLSSKLIFSIAKRGTKLIPQEMELQILMFHLMDFQEIKKSTLLAGINYFSHDYAYPTFMLSFEPDQDMITVWLLAYRKGKLMPTTLLKYKYPQEKQILSAKFQTEDYLIIQTYEELEDGALIEIEIFKLASILSQANICFDPQYKVKLQYENSKSEALVLKSQQEMTIHFEGPPSRGAFMNICNGDRIFFCTKGKHAFVFAFNLQKKVLETVYPISLTEELQTLLIPKNQDTALTPNRITIFAIDTNTNISILDYDTEGLQYNSRNFFESKEKNSIEGGPQTNQVGSFINHKGELHEYLIIFKENTFYHIDLKLQILRKIILVCPNAGGEFYNSYREPLGIIRRNTVCNWTVYEDLIAIFLANQIICIYKFTSDGQLIRLTLEDHRLFSLKHEKMGPGNDWLFTSDIGLKRKVEAPVVCLNHCYLMVLQFNSEENFDIHMTSIQGLFTCLKKRVPDYDYDYDSHLKNLVGFFDAPEEPEPIKGIWNWEGFFQNGGEKVDMDEYMNTSMLLHKAGWEVQTQTHLDNPKRVDLFSCLYVGESGNKVKFQGNSLLVYRKGFNVFFNFQSKMNFQKREDVKWMVTYGYHGNLLVKMDERLEDLRSEQVNKEKNSIVPQIKNPHIGLRDNKNTVIQENKEESKESWSCSDRKDPEDKKKERKKMIKKLINPRGEDKSDEVNDFLGMPEKERKSKVEELVLRKLKKTKDSEKIKRRDQGTMKKNY